MWDVIFAPVTRLHLATQLIKMAAMTSTFLGSAVAVKAPVVAAKKAAVAPVASLDGLKKVRIGSGELQSGKTYPRRLTARRPRGGARVDRATRARSLRASSWTARG